MDDCLFCKIIRKEVPASIRYETDDVVAFDDIHPKAPIHILIIPKRHIDHLSNATSEDEAALSTLLPAARDIAHQLALDGFNLRLNNGATYGQTVAHVHLHLVSGQAD